MCVRACVCARACLCETIESAAASAGDTAAQLQTVFAFFSPRKGGCKASAKEKTEGKNEGKFFFSLLCVSALGGEDMSSAQKEGGRKWCKGKKTYFSFFFCLTQSARGRVKWRERLEWREEDHIPIPLYTTYGVRLKQFIWLNHRNIVF